MFVAVVCGVGVVIVYLIRLGLMSHVLVTLTTLFLSFYKRCFGTIVAVVSSSTTFKLRVGVHA